MHYGAESSIQENSLPENEEILSANHAAIFTQLRTILYTECDVEIHPLQLHHRLDMDLNLDSVGLMSLACAIEEQWHLPLPATLAEQLSQSSLQDIVHLIAQQETYENAS